jgi:hypothetical protein
MRSLVLRNIAAEQFVVEAQSHQNLTLGQFEIPANPFKLLCETARPGRGGVLHRETPPDEDSTLTPSHLLDTMVSSPVLRFRFAVSWNLPRSTAMLMTPLAGD